MSGIDEYLSSLTPALKSQFKRIRKIVAQTVPEAEETISYGMTISKN